MKTFTTLLSSGIFRLRAGKPYQPPHSPSFGTQISIFILAFLAVGNTSAFSAESAAVEITLSSQIKEMLNKAEPPQTEKLQKSIRAGNTLITRFMDFSVYREDDTWPQRVGALLAIRPEELDDITRQWNGFLLVCPHIRLIELIQTDSGAQLTYKTTGIGMLIRSGSQFNMPPPEVPYADRFSPIENGRSYSMQLKINANGKLLGATSEDGLVPESYVVEMSGLKLPHHKKPMYIGETADLVKARVASDAQEIKDISQAASKFCGSESTNNFAKEK